MSDMKEYMRKYYQENKVRMDSQHKEWEKNNKESLNEYRRSYYKDHRKKILSSGRRWRDNNLEKRPSHTAVYRAIKSGDLIRPNHCEMCNKECYPDGHHNDYDKKLSVVWVCRECHKKLS